MSLAAGPLEGSPLEDNCTCRKRRGLVNMNRKTPMDKIPTWFLVSLIIVCLVVVWALW